MFNAKSTSQIGTWNARTLNKSGCLEQVVREISAYRLAVLGVSEMWWKGLGMQMSWQFITLELTSMSMVWGSDKTQKQQNWYSLGTQSAIASSLYDFKQDSSRLRSSRFVPVMISLEAVSCLETASRQFLGALALVVIVLALGVWVSVLSRVSAMLSWPRSEDKAVSRHLSISSSCNFLCIL